MTPRPVVLQDCTPGGRGPLHVQRKLMAKGALAGCWRALGQTASQLKESSFLTAVFIIFKGLWGGGRGGSREEGCLT